jgi:tRNA (guanine37-N1)-methyltransferase
MRVDVITLFPGLFGPFLTEGVTRRAYCSGQITVHLWNPRDFSERSDGRIDDRPFGGGPGMVMQAEPLARCLEAIEAQRKETSTETPPVQVILFDPKGQVLQHQRLAKQAHAPQDVVLICGRYEGIDQRFIDEYVDQTLSLGDFVLSGGEIAALAWLDAVSRLQPGVLGDQASAEQDSFHPQQQGLLDCPHYTRPAVWRGLSAPPVLLSGDHRAIEQWRKNQRLSLTAQHRPDLLESLTPSVDPAQDLV